jgi:hypothetical protein
VLILGECRSPVAQGGRNSSLPPAIGPSSLQRPEADLFTPASENRFPARGEGTARDSVRMPETEGYKLCDRDRFACKDFERNWDTMVSSEL